MKKNLLLSILIAFCIHTAFAGKVDTLSIYSQAMKKEIPCVVILPSSYKKKKNKFPVLYLLHGYSGSYNNWIRKVPQIEALADDYNMMIVCPDGGYSSWYFDSPIDSAFRYETHVAIEVVDYIDAHYRTIPDARHRAITGLSMGGHGSLFLALRHPKRFGAAGSMSGGVDINASRLRFDISKRIGDTLNYADNWKKYAVLYIIDHTPPQNQALIIDCGTEDFYFEVNRRLHEKLLRLKIPHDYIERPGKHDWPYWSNAIQYQLLYFRDFFARGGRG